MTLPDAESISRSALLLANSGEAASFEEAEATLEAETIAIIAGPECATSRAHQAAVLTAANTARRAVGIVPVVASRDVLDAPVLAGTMQNLTLAAALERLRATPVGELPVGEHSALAIGDAGFAGHATRVTWAGWCAALLTDPTRRLAEDDSLVLAAIAAAAIGVSEAFQSLRGHHEAGRRDVTISLWDPGSNDALAAQGPRVEWLPQEWAFIGLGHLGQAYGWCIGFLPYADPRAVLLLLQDTDVVTRATLGTGLLTFDGALDKKKTRVVATELERVGFSTSIVERRLQAGDRVHAGEPQLALIGVDNIETRRALSEIGWELCIDAGLGRGASSYKRIRFQGFPGPQSSDEVAAWTVARTSNGEVLSRSAYENLGKAGADECGLIMIAEKAVAVTFVGTIAACLALSEPLRALHGGVRLGVSKIDLSMPQHVTFVTGADRDWLPPATPRG